MPCSICQHADQAAMVEALSHDSLRTVAERYGVGKSTLARHMAQCPRTVPAASQAVTMSPMGKPTAPAHLVNAAVHAEAMQLYAMLSNHNILVDTRRGLMALTLLVLQVVRDTEGDRTTGR